MDSKYTLVEDEPSSEKEGVDEQSPVRPRQSRTVLVLSAALIICIGLIIFLGLKCAHLMNKVATGERTKYAGLARNIPVPWTVYGEYDNRKDEAASDALWDKISIDLGVIALPDEYVEKMDLHRAQRFPWDKTKGVYLINAYHNLHCLLKMRTAFMEYHRGEKISGDFAHITHCLDGFRQDIICDADDTPRWSGYGHRITGVGQNRMCRDWNQLDNWAKKFPSCWKYTNDTNVDVRFSYCPKDSPYAQKIIEKLGDNNHLGEH